MRIPLTSLVVGEDHIPVMHLPAIVDLVDGRRVDRRPVDVEQVGNTGFYRILNGRHRYVAALITGLPTLDCTVRVR